MNFKKTYLTKLLALTFSSGAILLTSANAQAPSKPSSQAEIVVTKKYANNLVVELSDLNSKRLSVEQLKPLLSAVSKLVGFQVVPSYKLGDRFLVVKIPHAKTDSDMSSAKNRLLSLPEFLNVELDPIVTPSSVSTFNDPGWPQTFNSYTGASTSSSNPDKAFYKPKFLEVMSAADNLPMQNVTVALIDSGIATGLIDIGPADFAFLGSVVEGESPSSGIEPRTAKADYHGTQMSGILKAKRNNNVGVAGLTPGVTLTMIRVFNERMGSVALLSNAILMSMNMHDKSQFNVVNPKPANIINMSLGTAPGVECLTFLQDSIDKAVNAGAILVAASGNAGATQIASPSNCRSVIGVGGVQTTGFRLFSSNISSQLITNSFGGGGNQESDLPVLVPERTNEFAMGSSTSNATAVTSAYLAVAKAANPQLTSLQAISDLSSTGSSFNPKDQACGSGACGKTLDVSAFMLKAANLKIDPTQAPTAAPTPAPTAAPTPAPTAAPPASGEFQSTSGQTPPIQIGSIATNIGTVTLRKADGAITSASSAILSGSAIQVTMESDGQYIIKFSGTPQSNTSSPQATQPRNYGFSTARAGNRVFVGQVVELAEGQDPPAIQIPGNTQPAQTPASGGGGGGSMGLLGLAGLFATLFATRQRRK